MIAILGRNALYVAWLSCPAVYDGYVGWMAMIFMLAVYLLCL
jgi:hypothetical protein